MVAWIEQRSNTQARSQAIGTVVCASDIFMEWNWCFGLNRTTSAPIYVLLNDVDKGLLHSGIQDLLFQIFQEIKVEDKS